MNDAATSPGTLDRIDGIYYRDALVAGIHRVVSRRDYINRINVFPVADADTGTNLAFTLNAVLVGATRKAGSHIGEFFANVADDALDGARGNSGAIFAQYVQGFSETIVDLEVLTPGDYVRAALEGARSARGAIAEPREGTMLSVIRDYAEALGETLDAGVNDFRALWAAGLEQARRSLENTPNQLAVLKENGVVDAGAQGFVDLLEGIEDYVERGEMTEIDDAKLVLDDGPEIVLGHDSEAEHRFCTECIVTGESIDRRRLRERLQDLDCSSLVIAGTKKKVRVHLHVDNPAKAYLACEAFGEVSSQKADDMRQQQRSRDALHRVAVVADTGADLPEGEMERLGVNLVPLRVNFGDQQYLDKVSLSSDEFYQLIQDSAEPPKTSQPPPGDYRRQFEFLASHFEQVICLCVSSKLSGTWQAAESAARRVDPERVRTWDTLNASCGHGLLTLYAAEAVQAGLDADQVLAALDFMRPRTKTFAVLKDLSYGVRGGRIPPWLQHAAGWLRVTAIIKSIPEGRVVPAGAVRATGSLPMRFGRWLVRRMDAGVAYRLMIGHCNARDDARELRDELVARLPMIQSVLLADVGTAIGAHAGPGSLVVGMQDYLAPADWLAAQGGGAS